LVDLFTGLKSLLQTIQSLHQPLERAFGPLDGRGIGETSFDGLFEDEEIFVGKFLEGHDFSIHH
jgi:hypothetical protein